MKRVSVRYFAALREQRGLSHEVVLTESKTPGQLFEELRAKHGFVLPKSMLKVIVNNEFASWDHPLSENDIVVFVPPVAGG